MTARTRTTPSSATTAGLRAVTEPPPPTVVATTSAISNACATSSTAVSTPSPAVTTTNAWAVPERPSNLRSSADMWPPVLRRAPDALAVLERSELSILRVVERGGNRPVQTYQLLRDRRPVGTGHTRLQVH